MSLRLALDPWNRGLLAAKIANAAAGPRFPHPRVPPQAGGGAEYGQASLVTRLAFGRDRPGFGGKLKNIIPIPDHRYRRGMFTTQALEQDSYLSMITVFCVTSKVAG
jgi:hypothetical protein